MWKLLSTEDCLRQVRSGTETVHTAENAKKSRKAGKMKNMQCFPCFPTGQCHVLPFAFPQQWNQSHVKLMRVYRVCLTNADTYPVVTWHPAFCLELIEMCRAYCGKKKQCTASVNKWTRPHCPAGPGQVWSCHTLQDTQASRQNMHPTHVPCGRTWWVVSAWEWDCSVHSESL